MAYNKHGLTNTTDYRTWHGIMTRHRRGETEVDWRWHSFERFLRDLGRKPHGTRLIKKDIHEPYSRENCFYGTREQATGRTEKGRYYQAWRARRGIATRGGPSV